MMVLVGVLENNTGIQVVLNRTVFIVGARVHNTDFQPARQSAGALRFCDHGQCANKTTNIQNIVTDSALVDGIHALLVEFLCCDKILVRQHEITIVSLQCGIGCSLKLTNNATRLFKIQSVEAGHGCFVLLHDTFIVCVLSTKQDTILVHLDFASAREEQETCTVGQGVCEGREEVGF